MNTKCTYWFSERIGEMWITPVVWLLLAYATVYASPQQVDSIIVNPDLFEGDIKLTDAQKKAVENAIETEGNLEFNEESGAKFGLTNVYPKWKDGIVVWDFASSIGYLQRTGIMAAMKEWNQKTNGCISFRRRAGEKNYLEFYVGNGCWGHMGQPNGKSQISVGANCHHQHIMAHEIGHALGFWHEQNRPDRDSYIQVLWGSVPNQFKDAFKKFGVKDIDSLGVPYDYGSVMHYPWNAFSTTGRNTMRPLKRVRILPYTSGISALDVKQAKLFYECGGTQPITKKPPVEPVTKCVEEQLQAENRDSSCQDASSSCASWASRGECSKNPAYMLTSCKKSCGKCGGSGSCVDKNKNCAYWAKAGYCSVRDQKEYMESNCKKSCKKCGPTTTKKCHVVTPPPTPAPTKPKTQPITKPDTTVIPTPPTDPPTDAPITPPIPQDCETPISIGIAAGSATLLDSSQLTASSSESRWHGPQFGRLNLAKSSESVGAWCSAIDDASQFFQIDLSQPKRIKKVQIQGRDSTYPKYVKSFTLSFSNDGTEWIDVVDAGGNKNVYGGNVDTTGVVDVNVDGTGIQPVVARFVRINPTEWENKICLRAELLAC